MPCRDQPYLFPFVFLLVFFIALNAQGQRIPFVEEWRLEPGDRPFLSTGNEQRDLAYNPATNHLLLINDGEEIEVLLLNPDDGTLTGTLSVKGISGGSRHLNRITVTEDGVIYAVNQTTNALTSSPLKVYRWPNEGADPEVIFSGDPTGQASHSRGYGNVLLARGTGQNTELFLLNSGGDVVVRLAPDETGKFAARPAVIGVFGLVSLTFGPEELFFGSSSNVFYEFAYDREPMSFTETRSIPGIYLPTPQRAIWSAEKGWLVTIHEEFLSDGQRPHLIHVYDQSRLLIAPRNYPLLSYTFDVANRGRPPPASSVVCDGDRIFAAVLNNGLVALRMEQPLAVGIDLHWTTPSAVRRNAFTGPRNLYSSLSGDFSGLVHDRVSQRFFFTDAGDQDDPGDGRLFGGWLHGSVGSAFPILDGRANPRSMAFWDGRLYWAEWYEGVGETISGLFTALANGTDVQQLIDLGDEGPARAVVVAPDGSVYLGTPYKLYRATDTPTAPEEVLDLKPETFGLALDPEANILYGTAPGVIYSVDMSTGEHRDLFVADEPRGLALTRDFRQLFWIDHVGGAIRTASADGNGEVWTLLTGEVDPVDIAILSKNHSTWRTEFGLTPQDDPDGDGDGVHIYFEYAFGGDPTVAGTAPMPTPHIEYVDEVGHLALAVTRDPNAVSFDVIVEVSSDLKTWSSGPGHTVVLEDRSSRLVVRDAMPLDDSTRRFIRVRLASLLIF